MAGRTIESVFAERSDQLLEIPGVVGAAIGKYKNQPCIKLYVNQKTSELLKQIPATLEGYKVRLQETGELRPLEK